MPPDIRKTSLVFCRICRQSITLSNETHLRNPEHWLRMKRAHWLVRSKLYPWFTKPIPLPVLPFYSYVVTLDMEICMIWSKASWDLTTLIFLVNRYLPMAWTVAIFLMERLDDGGDTTLNGVYVLSLVGVFVTSISQAGTYRTFSTQNYR